MKIYNSKLVLDVIETRTIQQLKSLNGTANTAKTAPMMAGMNKSKVILLGEFALFGLNKVNVKAAHSFSIINTDVNYFGLQELTYRVRQRLPVS